MVATIVLAVLLLLFFWKVVRFENEKIERETIETACAKMAGELYKLSEQVGLIFEAGKGAQVVLAYEDSYVTSFFFIRIRELEDCKTKNLLDINFLDLHDIKEVSIEYDLPDTNSPRCRYRLSNANEVLTKAQKFLTSYRKECPLAAA